MTRSARAPLSPSVVGRSALRLSALAVGLAGGGAFVAACSLGDGVTPTCDPTAPASDPNACDLRVACDDGNGGVAASDACCVEAVQLIVERCAQRLLDVSWNEACSSTGALQGESCSFFDQAMVDKSPGIAHATQEQAEANPGVTATPVCDFASAAFDHCLAGGFVVSPGTGGGGAGGAGAGGAGAGGAGAGGAGGSGGSGGAGGN